MSRRFWTMFAVLVMLVLATSFILTQYEQVVESEVVPPAAEARRDRFLLAGRVLERLGVPSARIPSLDGSDPLPSDALLLVPAQRGAVSRTGIERLRRFVAAGGHLVIESERSEQGDPLFDAFDIRRSEYDWNYPKLREIGSYDETDKHADYPTDWAGTIAIRTDFPGPTLRVLMRGGESLHAGDTLWRAADRGGTRALAIAHGRGRLTAINDISFATNFELARVDNAEFLHTLVRVGGSQRVLFYRGHSENLGEWLWRNAWAPLLVLALVITLWLWWMMPRFGPMLPDPEPVRRRLLDHLAASGRFFWSRGQRNRLVVASCRRVQAVLLRRYPHLIGTRDAEQAAYIARQFGIAPALAQRIIEPPLVRDAREMIELTRACAAVECALIQQPNLSSTRTP